MSAETQDQEFLEKPIAGHLRDRLSALDTGDTGTFSREVIERALRQLGAGRAEGPAHAY